ncbi:hypothetical protein [Flavobacterium cellulosilyticum]|uniref:Uncharacterized protein n=1 Tax=Flavobacterium cellulosilyticum TaxID=2541731 RepID=A0A4R5CHA5_9FLAO|nr:hypothetical protein [Flavobacterium cellulosilyticum]TDD98449.1 hypothetical protein E0F76_04765 [Flavobacterium cellulosilyticum]
MKKIILVLTILLLIGCKTKKVINEPVEIKYIKLNNDEVSESQKKKAYDLGKRTLMICNTSKFIPFNESEATQSVIQNTTLEKHSKICVIYRGRYGNFKDLKLVEIIKDNTQNELIFRYKAIFDHSNANKELRVTLNEENKVSSLRTMNWTDVFKQ